MNVLSGHPNHIVISAVIGNCAGAIACALVVAAFLIGWGESGKLSVSGLVESSLSFAGYTWLIGLAYLVVVVPVVLTVLRFWTPPAAAWIGIALGIAPGLLFVLRGNNYYGSAGLAHGIVAALVAIGLSYGLWGGASNPSLNTEPLKRPG